MWSVWIVFSDCGFYFVGPLRYKVRDSWKHPDGRDWLWRKLGLVLMGRTMFSKCAIQFSVDGRVCVPSLLFDLRPNYGGGNEDKGDLLQNVLCMHCHSQCPQPCSRPPPTHISNGDSWTITDMSRSVFCGVTAPFCWVLVAQSFVCALQESVSPVLCKFWWLCGGVNGDLLQEGLCQTQVCCAWSPCSCSRALLTCTSTGDTQTLKGRSGSLSVRSPGEHKVLSEPSKHLWQVWDLILNAILPLLKSFLGFSFALGRGASFLVGSKVLLS